MTYVVMKCFGLVRIFTAWCISALGSRTVEIPKHTIEYKFT